MDGYPPDIDQSSRAAVSQAARRTVVTRQSDLSLAFGTVLMAQEIALGLCATARCPTGQFLIAQEGSRHYVSACFSSPQRVIRGHTTSLPSRTRSQAAHTGPRWRPPVCSSCSHAHMRSAYAGAPLACSPDAILSGRSMLTTSSCNTSASVPGPAMPLSSHASKQARTPMA